MWIVSGPPWLQAALVIQLDAEGRREAPPELHELPGPGLGSGGGFLRSSLDTLLQGSFRCESLRIVRILVSKSFKFQNHKSKLFFSFIET